jgi:hypothetical protein
VCRLPVFFLWAIKKLSAEPVAVVMGAMAFYLVGCSFIDPLVPMVECIIAVLVLGAFLRAEEVGRPAAGRVMT